MNAGPYVLLLILGGAGVSPTGPDQFAAFAAAQASAPWLNAAQADAPWVGAVQAGQPWFDAAQAD